MSHEASAARTKEGGGAGRTVQPRRSAGREWIGSIVFALAVWLVLRTFLFEAFRITSGSMERTMLTGDWLFVNKAIFGAPIPFTHVHTPAFREPRRGDIVVFRSVDTPGLDVVKRLIAVPGDTVAMKDGTVLLDGVAQSEPYVQHVDAAREETPDVREQMRRWELPYYIGRDTLGYFPGLQTWGPIVVPPGRYLMLGDNRDDSMDSRYWGLVPRDSIRGRPSFVYFSYDSDSWRPLPFLTAIRWDRFFRLPK